MDHLRKILSGFSGKKVAVVGDVMLDEYQFGKATRISPEAPVPVVRIESERYVLGGAANVAANVNSLGGKVSLFGFVGNDRAADKLTDLTFAEKNINFFFQQFSGPTTRKVRFISGQQQLFRADYEDTNPKPWDMSKLHELEAALEEADIIVISDYAKGAVSPDLVSRLKKSGKRIIVDPKPKNAFLYNGVFLVKLNENEACEISDCDNDYKAGESLRDVLNSNVLITRGSRGALLFDGSVKVKEFPAMAREVYDVTGAGDTVLATIAMSLAAGASLDDAVILANHAAGIKVEKFGTAAVSLSELEKRIFKEEENKIKTREELKAVISNYQAQGKKVVWTNGCFDILHQGHIRYLKSAAELGDILVIGLNSDESVRKLKGPTRPIQTQDARAEIVAALEFVDYVTVFPETRVTPLMTYLQPDIWVKGGDYVKDSSELKNGKQLMDQDERRAIESYGGNIVFIPVEVDVSTTKIADKLQRK